MWREKLYMLPEHMQGAMERYIAHGIPPGSFLTAVLEGDLFEAVGRADHINQQYLADYVTYLYNYAPLNCYGSREKIEAWVISGGMGVDNDN